MSPSSLSLSYDLTLSPFVCDLSIPKLPHIAVPCIVLSLCGLDINTSLAVSVLRAIYSCKLQEGHVPALKQHIDHIDINPHNPQTSPAIDP
jgi:hypothetical protein